MLLRLFIADMWPAAVKGLTFWFEFVMFSCVIVTNPSSILGQVWYLIVSVPDLCRLSFFYILKEKVYNDFMYCIYE